MTVTALESGVQTQEAELKLEPLVFQSPDSDPEDSLQGTVDVRYAGKGYLQHVSPNLLTEA